MAAIVLVAMCACADVRMRGDLAVLAGHVDVVAFTRMDGYVHDSQSAAVAALDAVARQRGLTLARTDHAGVMRQLALVDTLVFVHANGGPLDADEERAFRAWVEAGGHVVLLHGAVGDWWYPSPWWTEELIGARFAGHTLLPSVVERTARIHLGPLTAGMPHAFTVHDEIYSFTDVRIPRHQILVEIDGQPIAWSRVVGNGRVTVMALGHTEESWRADWMRNFLANVLESATRPSR